MIADLSPKQTRMVVLSVMLGLFLGAMEATVVATALPTIVSSLGGLNLYSWPMAIYILTSAASGPLFGKMSDLYGRRSLYLVSLAIFLMGSALSGLAKTMPQLIWFRGLQGLGAGGVLPLSIIIAGDMFPLHKRVKVQPLFSMVWGIASLVGPPLGMWLTTFSWRLVFFVNIPFGILSAILLLISLEEIPDKNRKISIDYLGGALLMAALLAFEIGLPQTGSASAFPLWRGLLLPAGFALIIFFIRHELSAEEPILPMGLMKYRIYSSASVCQFFSGMALFGSISFIPLFVQAVMGQGLHGTGRTLSFLLLSWVFFSFLASRLMLRLGYRLLVIPGAFLLSLGFLSLIRVSEAPSSGLLHLAVILLGAGMGWIMAPLIVAVQSGVPRKDLGSATSSQVLFRTTGATLGVSLMGSVMTFSMHRSLQSISPMTNQVLKTKLSALFMHPDQVLDPILRLRLSPEILTAAKSTMATSLHAVFMIALGSALLCFLAGFFVPAGKAEKHLHREES